MTEYLKERLNLNQIESIELDLEEVCDLRHLWIKQFVPLSFNKSHKDPLWHVFSYGNVHSTEGLKAINKFNTQYFKELTVFSSNSQLNGLKCITRNNKFLDYKTLQNVLVNTPQLGDLYINHHNLKWTFVITHENEFGPYYCFT